MALSNVSPLQLLPAKLWFNDSTSMYRDWKASALYLIQCQGLVGYIDGSCLPSSGSIDIWKRTDESLKQGILSLLEKDVAEVVKELNTSREMWLKLENKYDRDQNESVVEGHHIVTVRVWKEYYPKLYKAAITGDWDTATEIFDNHPEAVTAKLNSMEATPLHLAVASGKRSIKFVRNLVRKLSKEVITAKDVVGDTALSTAASVGNMGAARIIVEKDRNLVFTRNILGEFPVHIAAKHAKRNTLVYLILVTADSPNPVHQDLYTGLSGLALLISTIQADLLDVALYLVKKFPNLARLKLSSNSALKSIAEKELSYEDDRLFMPRVTRKKRTMSFYATSDQISSLHIDSESNIMEESVGILNELLIVARSKIVNAVMVVSDRDAWIKQRILLKLVKCLCEEIKEMSIFEAEDIYRDSILIAAKLGNYVVVKQILEAFPDAIYCSNPASFQNIFHVAVEHRSARVFSLICKMTESKHLHLDLPDTNGNTLLHLAAQLAPPHKLARLPNPAMQMQRELQWYTEVEQIVNPRCREQLNRAGNSPWMIFTNEHKSLMNETEKWVKSTINSCTITAVLISTISFTAAITVPGGSSSTTGYPLFRKSSVFMFFAVTDAISLIASATSLILFLSISTKPFSYEGFFSQVLHNIPKMVIFGMNCLAWSIFFMMIAFSATIFLVFGTRHRWVPILTVIVAMYILFVSHRCRDMRDRRRHRR